MERDNDDKLRKLFTEINRAQPSAGFEKALMSRVKREASLRSWLYMLLLPIIGGAIMIMGCLLAIRYFDPEWKLSETLQEIPSGIFRWEYILLPAMVLLLLVADTLIRKRLAKKRR